jgi:hypothetical protein
MRMWTWKERRSASMYSNSRSAAPARPASAHELVRVPAVGGESDAGNALSSA